LEILEKALDAVILKYIKIILLNLARYLCILL
jgi:hypothetical protein